MDWDLAIEKNRTALAQIIAELVTMARPSALPRHALLAILSILRPAESALRRLIVLIVARQRATNGAGFGLRNPVHAMRPLPDFSAFAPAAAAERPPCFRLCDPLKHYPEDFFVSADAPEPMPRQFNRGVPRISIAGYTAPAFAAPKPAPSLNAGAILRRIAALDYALKTLPRQARRMARLIGRKRLAPPGPKRRLPIRIGAPPGHIRKGKRLVDLVLSECHLLVRDNAWPPW